jgi:hypothetical protein
MWGGVCLYKMYLVWHENQPQPVNQVMACMAHFFAAAHVAMSPEQEKQLKGDLDAGSKPFICVEVRNAHACVSDSLFGTKVWGYVCNNHPANLREVRDAYNHACMEDENIEGIVVP